ATEGRQGRTFIARFKPGNELVSSVHQFLVEKGIRAGYIPTLLGGFKNLKLISMTFGEGENEVKDVELEYRQPLEYFGTGTIAYLDDQPSIHVHLTAAQSGNKSLTGHLVSGEIAILTEIVIVEITDVAVVRKEDPDIPGYKLLHFE
ncbi:MAG: DNA-binding protein, partial [Ktedonobacteraceae bacterium]|nr:DNA-binding protein [Ktedonobacteraceae bacterium]